MSWTISDITFEHTPFFAHSLDNYYQSNYNSIDMDGNIAITAGGSSTSSHVSQFVGANDGLGRAELQDL